MLTAATLHQDSIKLTGDGGVSVGKAFPRPKNVSAVPKTVMVEEMTSDLHTNAVALYPQKKM